VKWSKEETDMSRTLRLSMIAVLLLSTSTLGLLGYNALNPPAAKPVSEPASEPAPAPEPKSQLKKTRPIRLWPTTPPDPDAGCIAEAKYAFNKSDLTNGDLLDYKASHPRCLDTPVSMPMQEDAATADLKRREANLRQQIANCEGLSRQETLAPPGAVKTVLSPTPTVVQPISRADSCWKYAEIMRKALTNDQPSFWSSTKKPE
jgi:hypothetical protein